MINHLFINQISFIESVLLYFKIYSQLPIHYKLYSIITK